MAALSQQESRKRYSWWWDSHISPKNSKWLQENLTGMDSKVKQMIKLIEEDADSFARRAEMYYKRRPELMRLVEEFYRAYRALAERYDHATGVIRHAHKTMVEAFPDQDFMSDDLGEFFDHEEMQKDALGLGSPDIQVPKRKGLKQIDFFEKGMARKSLNFNEAREKERYLNNGSNHNAKNVGLNDSKHSVSKHDADISLLKETLVKLEAEKEAGLLNYQTSLERLSNLENEIKLAREDSDKLTARAIKAEAEVELLNGALIELKAEKELVHLQYQQCLNKIAILEEQTFCFEQDAEETSDRVKKAESEVQLLKRDIALLQAEKKAIAAQHKQCTETITDVETKLQQAEESVKRTNERAKVAESKVETLNVDIVKLIEEKNAYSVQCQLYLERISTLEFQILFSQEETQRLNEEISNGVLKLKDVEDQCLSFATSHQSLQSDLDSLMRNMESKNKELTEKQIELNRLWTCVQEERSRFVEAETAFQTLQHLHNESREELTALASELQNRAQTVLDLEEHNRGLQDEVSKIKEENRTLNEINLSSAVSMENMRDEISSLRATIVKLQEEIQIRATERNILQQEIFSLREEFNELKLKHGALLDQIESLELDPESFRSSVTELRDSSSKLNDAYQREKNEKVALLEKLEIMARLVEKNALLEISIADLNSELQQVKDKMKTLEATCHLLVEERSAIVAEKNALHSQIQVLTENSGALLVKNVFLENSLADANAELDALKEKSRRLEDSLLLIGIQKTGLLNESETLSSQLRVTKHRLEDTEIKYEKLEVKILDLETEKQFLICSISELCDSLNSAKKENSDTVKFYQTQLGSLECQLHLSHEESQRSKNMYNEELDTTVKATIEISILHNFLQALHENNTSLGHQCLELFEASQTFEKLISDLKQKYADQQAESKAVFEVLEKLEVKNCELETEKKFLICSISEMFDSSNSAKKETSDTIKFYQTQLASSECQLHLLQEEAQLSKNMYNKELDTTVRATIEISILHSFLQGLHGNNASLGRQCLELFEASQTSKKLISDLGQKYDDQQLEAKELFEVLEKLEVKNFDLETEKQILISSISELCDSLKFAKKENSDTVKFYQAQLARSECQLHLSQEEAQLLKNMHNEEQDKTVKAKMEFSILHSFLQELHGNNTSLGRKCLELFEASQTSAKLISDLEQKYADQQAESKALFEVLEKLRAGFYQMSKTLDLDKGITPRHMYEDIPFSNQPHPNHLLETAEEFKKALTTTLNENHQLLLEKSVLITLLQQLQLVIVDIDTEKFILSQNLEASAQRLLQLLTEVHVLSEMSEGLKKTMEEGDYREKLLRSDLEELSSNLLDVQGSYQTLQQADNLVLEEKKSLMKEISELKGAKCALEVEIHEVLGDAVYLSNIFLVFKDFYFEKSMEVKKLDGSMCQLHHIKDSLEEVIKQLEEKLQIMLEDKSRLVESLKASDNELKTLRSINSQLNREVSNGKELLSQREMDLSEAKYQHENLLNEQTILQSLIKDLKGHYENEKAVKEEQAEQISKLIKENGMMIAEYDDLCCAKHSLETELSELIKKHENVIAREVLYRKEYEELFKEQQVSGILEACYHEKFQELSQKFESTLSTMRSMASEARLLKERLTVLEVENAGLKAHFKEYNSTVKSLSDSVACLESQVISHEKFSKINVTQDDGTKQVPVQGDTSNAILATGCSELKNLQSRIQAVELAVDGIQKIASEGSPGSSVGAQRLLVHKNDLVSGRSFRKERVDARCQRRHNSGASSELSELPKDIMLDQVSDCSSYGQSQREIANADSHMLESWGTTNKDSSLNFSDAKVQKPTYGKKTSSSEITAEKEVTVVDKLDIPKSPKDPQQTGKKVKILERLHFDAQKLANLQKTVHDLKGKVGTAEKSKRTKSVIEYDTVKEQLEEAEEAIEKLYGVNERLTQTVEDDSLSSKYENGSDESGTVRRRRVLEQIRRASEKISRLHFEVQKLQFMLLKLEGEKDVDVKTRVIPRSPRVRLRDYLYGSSRQVFAHNQKRRQFCGCVRPSTKGD